MDADAREGDAVVDAAAGRLARAVRRHDGEPGVAGARLQVGGRRGAPDEDAAVAPRRVQGAQADGVVALGGVEDVTQLRRDEARVDGGEGRRVAGDERRGPGELLERPGVHDDRCRARDE